MGGGGERGVGRWLKRERPGDSKGLYHLFISFYSVFVVFLEFLYVFCKIYYGI